MIGTGQNRINQMTKKPNWKSLFLEARKMLEEEVDRHEVGCGCQDGGDPVVEGPCPGLPENKKFLERTAQFVPKEMSE
jgi:hypothetical protein